MTSPNTSGTSAATMFCRRAYDALTGAAPSPSGAVSGALGEDGAVAGPPAGGRPCVLISGP
ncbi:hypothetical protein GCM10022214_17480 [Actinomadura miaoliensis]|uniref:Uncharacterized protein n=1 Tax=Actinomadura miaoliensis TaxID=430685 RepID=A0ABP7VCF3_9ACTN